MRNQIQLMGSEFTARQTAAGVRAAKAYLAYHRVSPADAYQASCAKADGAAHDPVAAGAWAAAEQRAISAARSVDTRSGISQFGGILVFRQARHAAVQAA